MVAPSSSSPSAMSTLLTLILVLASSTRKIPFSTFVVVLLVSTFPFSSSTNVVSDVIS